MRKTEHSCDNDSVKYVPGPFIGQLSGTLGNTVASHNRNGSYLRARVVPVNPNTARQTLFRNNVQELAQLWKTCTAAQQNAWRSLGDQMERLNPQGQTYTLSGFQAFMSNNQNRRLLSIADTLVAPAMPTVDVLTSMTLTYITIGGFDVAYTPTPLGAEEHLVVFATGPKSPGVNFASNGDFRLIQIGAAAGASPLDITTAYEAIFGATTEGQKIFVRGLIMNEDGFAGDFLQGSVLRGA